jgi:hypothetical protein
MFEHSKRGKTESVLPLLLPNLLLNAITAPTLFVITYIITKIGW